MFGSPRPILASQEQSSGLFTLGVVGYCLGVALVCERLNLSHEVGTCANHNRRQDRVAPMQEHNVLTPDGNDSKSIL